MAVTTGAFTVHVSGCPGRHRAGIQSHTLSRNPTPPTPPTCPCRNARQENHHALVFPRYDEQQRQTLRPAHSQPSFLFRLLCVMHTHVRELQLAPTSHRLYRLCEVKGRSSTHDHQLTAKDVRMRDQQQNLQRWGLACTVSVVNILVKCKIYNCLTLVCKLTYPMSSPSLHTDTNGRFCTWVSTILSRRNIKEKTCAARMS